MVATCPEYRMRLFMSVDLVGSTAFKASKKHSEPQNGNPNPGWVDEFRAFYKDFPTEVASAYQLALKVTDSELQERYVQHPLVWKTIGDEIIMCCRVQNVEHTAICVSAFLRALEQYSKRLEVDDKPLRLKGAGWLAAFPAPNISISITSNIKDASNAENSDAGENEESFEQTADNQPYKFDFLGKGIDTGFRLAKNASEDRFVTSVQLAYVLSVAANTKKFPHSFGYHGREVLKGVIDGTPYPVISVDTERSEIKSRLKSREAALLGESSISPHALCDFLTTFMEVAGIEIPCLSDDDNAWQNELPESYRRYKRAFEEQLAIDESNLEQVVEDNEPETPDNRSIIEAESFLKEFLKALANFSENKKE